MLFPMEKARQVIVVHGGETHASYDDYLAYLRTVPFDPFEERGKSWRDLLPETLGEGFSVIAPKMPCKQNAKYAEWSIWFRRLVPFLEDGALLIGHSLGGVFLAKFLSEEELPVRIAGLFLVAAPFDEEDAPYSLADFSLTERVHTAAERCGRIYIYHSKDDPVVPFADAEKYARVFPEAAVRRLDGRGHFSDAEFSEIISDMKKCAEAYGKNH